MAVPEQESIRRRRNGLRRLPLVQGLLQRGRMPLPLAEVRVHALAEHARLRARIESLVRESLPTGRRVGHAALRALLGDLRSAVQSHAELEERELRPLLQTIDAWGPVRVSQLQDRHDAILHAIDAFAAAVAPGEHHPCNVVERIDSLVGPLLRDLDEEEAALATFEETCSPFGNQETG